LQRDGKTLCIFTAAWLGWGWAPPAAGGRPPPPTARALIGAARRPTRGGQRGRQFGWGGSLLKSNGGAQKAPQAPAGAMQAAPDRAADTPPWDGASCLP